MKESIGIVFIHGAGLGSFIWNDLIPLLDIPALAIDFPNRNIGDNANADLTFQFYTKSVIGQIENWNRGKIILVAHSIGGCVGLEVAKNFENDLVGFIAIGAAIPLNNNSFASCLPFPKNLLMAAVINLFGTKPPKKSIEKDLCNGLTKEYTEKIVNSFTPEARELYTKRIKYKQIDVPTLYIQLSQDRTSSLKTQKEMANNLKAARIETINSGHLPMISHAKELSVILNGFIKMATQSA